MNKKFASSWLSQGSLEQDYLSNNLNKNFWTKKETTNKQQQNKNKKKQKKPKKKKE